LDKGIDLKKNKGYRLLILLMITLIALSLSACKSKPQAAEPAQTTVQEAATTTAAPKEEFSEEVPEEIERTIEQADAFFKNGDYSDAQQQYRKAEIALKAADVLSPVKKQELLSYVVDQKEQSADITSIARIHFGNAMMLQYEKRFEDALEELGFALKAYPKYQDAIDAMDSLEAMMGLS
jgi:tetratricopeptide (TPR) repeat protein